MRGEILFLKPSNVSTIASPHVSDGFETDSCLSSLILFFLLVRSVYVVDVFVNASLSRICFTIWLSVAVNILYFLVHTINDLEGGYRRNTSRSGWTTNHHNSPIAISNWRFSGNIKGQQRRAQIGGRLPHSSGLRGGPGNSYNSTSRSPGGACDRPASAMDGFN